MTTHSYRIILSSRAHSGAFYHFFLKIDSSAWDKRIVTVEALKFRVSSVDWRKTIIDSGQKLPESENERKKAIFTNFLL